MVGSLTPGQQTIVAESFAALPFQPILLVSMDGAEAASDLVGTANALKTLLTSSQEARASFSSSELETEVRSVSGAQDLVRVSLGVGQQQKANAAISRAARNGSWLLLENIHLSMDWARDSLG